MQLYHKTFGWKHATSFMPLQGPTLALWMCVGPPLTHKMLKQAVNLLAALSPSFHHPHGFYIASNFMFCVSFYVQNTFYRVMGNFVFLGIQRPDSSSSGSERRHGPVLWVRGYSCVTGSCWGFLATQAEIKVLGNICQVRCPLELLLQRGRKLFKSDV